MAEKFDRERFAYELAQELGIERARWARGPTSQTAVAGGIQRTLERGPESSGALAQVPTSQRLSPPGAEADRQEGPAEG